MSENLLALRAFDAAARHGSFTAAAQELGLTQSCISRHVRTIEATHGCMLFVRSARRVTLTQVGSQFHAELRPGFDIIRAATAGLRSRTPNPNSVVVSLPPSVAALWLAPHLSDFAARNPRVELIIQSTRNFADFDIGQVDLAVRYGQGRWPGVEAELLGHEVLFPVCAPALATGSKISDDPGSLLGVPLLGEDLVDGWPDWFTSAGVDDDPPVVSKQFDDSASLYYAAANGLGVALGRSALIGHWLADGRLLRVGSHELPSSYSYWLVRPRHRSQGPAVRLFATWLRDKFAAERSSPPPMGA